MYDFKNKSVLITGGASGIGYAIANLFQSHGGKVVILDANPNTPEISRNIGAKGLICDLTKDQSVGESLSQVDRVDILVNNAGIVRLAECENLSEADWDATMAINTKSHFLLGKYVIPEMKQRKLGRIINISSQASIVALEGHIAYCASKAAVDAMTRVMALELGPCGITVNAVAPTVVMTELGKQAWAGEKGEQMKAKIPVRRFGEPEDIANAVLFLASDASSLINGHTLVLDGGYTIQ